MDIHRVSPDGKVYGIFDDGVVYRSTTKGQQWDRVGTVAPTAISLGLFVADPVNANVLYVMTFDAGLYASTDGGANWERRGLDRVEDLRFASQLLIDPSDPNPGRNCRSGL